jgi:drug/metabolite transporter (DMT)-like permease
MNGSKAKAYVILSISTLIFGFSFIAGKTALKAVNNDVFNLLSYRFIFASIILTAIVLIRKHKISYKGKDKKNLILLCFFSPVLAFLFNAMGLSRISSFEAGLFVALIPVFTLMLNYLFFKEKITKLRLLFVIISIIGVFIINIFGLRQGESSGLGRIFMLIMVISVSLYLMYSIISSKEYSPMEITWTMMLVGAIIFSIIAVTKNLINGTMNEYLGLIKNSSFLISVLYLAAGCSVIAYLGLNYSIPKLKVSIVAIFGNLTPIIAIFAGVIFLKESIYWYHILGSVVIIGGVLGASLLVNEPKEEQELIKESKKSVVDSY